MFVSEHHEKELGNSPDGTDRNIRLIGKNVATLFEKDYKGNSVADKLPKEDSILLGFLGVEGFKI